MEYSAITTYCCGAPSKGDCKASGGTYSGPESPCEVLKVDVSAGPPVCTGFSEASGLLTQCSCGGGAKYIHILSKYKLEVPTSYFWY